MATKHEQILDYIEQLSNGDRISVRRISKHLKVSEGTSYRAIKEAEARGLVSTLDRVGTIRVEGKRKKSIDQLTFQEVARVCDAEILGGEQGLETPLNNFIIGAMQEKSIARYIPKSGVGLMIVGNRFDIQRYALENGLAVLITGDFDTEQSTIDLANEKQLPIFKTSYDTFTTATLIDRAMRDSLIKKEILLVSDSYTTLEETNYLFADEKVEDYRKLVKKVIETRFPVVDKQRRVVGVIAGSDAVDVADDVTIQEVMTKTPFSAALNMSIASVSHQMVWNEVEMMPVVAEDKTLQGVITRFDVMKAIQRISRISASVDTLSDKMREGIEKEKGETYKVVVTPRFINQYGGISYGVLCEQMSEVVESIFHNKFKQNVVIEQMNLVFLKMIPLESTLFLFPTVLETSKRRAVVEVVGKVGVNIVVKAMITIQMMERNK